MYSLLISNYLPSISKNKSLCKGADELIFLRSLNLRWYTFSVFSSISQAMVSGEKPAYSTIIRFICKFYFIPEMKHHIVMICIKQFFQLTICLIPNKILFFKDGNFPPHSFQFRKVCKRHLKPVKMLKL